MDRSHPIRLKSSELPPPVDVYPVERELEDEPEEREVEDELEERELEDDERELEEEPDLDPPLNELPPPGRYAKDLMTPPRPEAR